MRAVAVTAAGWQQRRLAPAAAARTAGVDQRCLLPPLAPERSQWVCVDITETGQGVLGAVVGMRRIKDAEDGSEFVCRVPLHAQAAAAAAAGAISGCAVALPLAIIDRAVVEGVTNVAGKVRGA